MTTVRFKSVSKTFGAIKVVKELDLELPDGSFTVLVGPSGCGKTTSLRMLAGLEAVTSGDIYIGDRRVTHLEPKERNAAMVFQNYALYPHLSVRENIAFPLRATKVPKTQALRRAEDVAGPLGLESMLDRRPRELSGGQQQRVAIGRAIVREPAVFLFDEPLSNLDAKLRVETRTELLQIQRQLGITSLYVTHDQEEAMTLSDRMVVMKDGEIAQAGSPEEVFAKPANVFVATFVGSPKMNLLRGVLTNGAFRSGALALHVDEEMAVDPVTLGVRPDDLVLTPADDESTSIVLIELLGPRAIVTLDAGGEKLTSVVGAAELSGLAIGSAVRLSIRPGGAHLFDAKSGVRLTNT